MDQVGGGGSHYKLADVVDLVLAHPGGNLLALVAVGTLILALSLLFSRNSFKFRVPIDAPRRASFGNLVNVGTADGAHIFNCDQILSWDDDANEPDRHPPRTGSVLYFVRTIGGSARMQRVDVTACSRPDTLQLRFNIPSLGGDVEVTYDYALKVMTHSEHGREEAEQGRTSAHFSCTTRALGWGSWMFRPFIVDYLQKEVRTHLSRWQEVTARSKDHKWE